MRTLVSIVLACSAVWGLSCGGREEATGSRGVGSAQVVAMLDTARAQNRTREAWLAFNEGRYEQSAKLANEAIELDARCAQAWTALGYALLSRERWESSSAAFEKAQSLLQCADRAVAVGLMFSRIGLQDWPAAKLAIAQNATDHPNSILCDAPSYPNLEPTDRVAAATKLARANPQQAVAHYVLGCALNSVSNWKGAASAFQRACELDPTFLVALECQAIALSNDGRRSDAAAIHTRCIESGATFATPWAGRADATRVVDPKGAIRDYIEAIRRCPDRLASRKWNVSLGCARFESGDTDGAMQAFTDAIIAHGGAAYLHLGRTPEEAATMLARWIDSSPNNPFVCYEQGVIAALVQKDHAEAARHFKRAAEIRPDWAAALFCLASEEEELGKSVEAMEGFLRAAKAEPRCAVAWLRAGKALLDAGERERAKEAYAAAFRAHPNWAPMLRAQAWVALLEGEYSKCIEIETTALSIEWDADSLYRRGKARMESGDVAGGLVDMDQSIQWSPSARANLARGLYRVAHKQVDAGIDDLLHAQAAVNQDSPIHEDAWKALRPLVKVCSSCGGDGGHSESERVLCMLCAGSGSSGVGSQGVGNNALRNQCATCGGSGRVHQNKYTSCGACGGAGIVRR